MLAVRWRSPRSRWFACLSPARPSYVPAWAPSKIVVFFACRAGPAHSDSALNTVRDYPKGHRNACCDWLVRRVEMLRCATLYRGGQRNMEVGCALNNPPRSGAHPARTVQKARGRTSSRSLRLLPGRRRRHHQPPAQQQHFDAPPDRHASHAGRHPHVFAPNRRRPGGRDHTTVIYGCDKIGREMALGSK